MACVPPASVLMFLVALVCMLGLPRGIPDILVMAEIRPTGLEANIFFSAQTLHKILTRHSKRRRGEARLEKK